jgi:Co/Zn/Cd efflux system component
MAEKKDKKRLRRLRDQKLEFWKDMDELHRIMRRFPGYFRGFLLELLDKPLSRQEIQEIFTKMQLELVGRRRRRNMKVNLDRDIALAIELSVLQEQGGKLHLTQGGREIAEHMQAAIPLFMEYAFSAKAVLISTIIVHILLSIVKLTFGFLSRSAGLFSDGIDNTVDTVSSVLVWLGIKFDKEKLVSFFIVAMMFVSVAGVGLVAFNKIIHPGPVKEGLITFIISALCGLIMLMLSAYQYATGKRNSNFSIMCQSVDSRNHFLTSLLVCIGIALSFTAVKYQAHWLYYADAGASIIIGFLILKSAIGLSVELFKPAEEPKKVPHFIERARDKRKSTILLAWLKEKLKNTALTPEQLEEKYVNEFCGNIPKIFLLSGIGYPHISREDLQRYLEKFVKNKGLIFTDGKYSLP